MNKKKELIPHSVNDIVVEQRKADGFINGTAMCVAHGKEITFWLRNNETLETFMALFESLNKKSNPENYQDLDTSRLSAADYSKFFPNLIISKRGSPNLGGGVWLHPDLAIQLAQWCSATFAIQVSRWIREWMITGKNPIHTQDDIDRLVLRPTLKDESRIRATGQVKAYLENEDLYEDKEHTRKIFVQFHDQINIAITGEPAWKMKKRLSAILGKDVKNELIRDYFPAMPLQKYIAITDAAANLMAKKGLHPIAAVEEAADLVLPMGYVPTPINFVEHIDFLRQKLLGSSELSNNPTLESF
jgi:hypothetical protein